MLFPHYAEKLCTRRRLAPEIQQVSGLWVVAVAVGLLAYDLALCHSCLLLALFDVVLLLLLYSLGFEKQVSWLLIL